MGDCADVLNEVLRLQGDGSPMLSNRVGELVANQGGYVKQGIYVGLVVGLCAAVAALIAYCQVRARRRKLQLTNRTYTPYGQSDDDFAGGAPAIASAVDEEED